MDQPSPHWLKLLSASANLSLTGLRPHYPPLQFEDPHALNLAKRREFCTLAALDIDDRPPSLLVLSSETLPVALMLRRRPHRTVLYVTRSLDGLPLGELLLMQTIRSRLDQIIWPSSAQAEVEAGRMGWPKARTLVVVPATTHKSDLMAASSTLNRPTLQIPSAALSGLFPDIKIGQHARLPGPRRGPFRAAKGCSSYSFCPPEAFASTDQTAESLFAPLANAQPVMVPDLNPYQSVLQEYGCAVPYDDLTARGLRRAALQTLRHHGQAFRALQAGAVEACATEFNWETQYLANIQRWRSRFWADAG